MVNKEKYYDATLREMEIKMQAKDAAAATSLILWKKEREELEHDIQSFQNNLSKLFYERHCYETQMLIFQEKLEMAQVEIIKDEVKQYRIQSEEMELQKVRKQMLAVEAGVVDFAVSSNRHPSYVHHELLGAQESTRILQQEVSRKGSEVAHGKVHASELVESGHMSDMACIEVEDDSADNTREIASVAHAVDPSKQPEQRTPNKEENLSITVFFTDDIITPAVEEAQREANGAPAELEAEPEVNAAPAELSEQGRRSFFLRNPQAADDKMDWWRFGEKIDNINIQCLACGNVIKGDRSHLRRHLTRCEAFTSRLHPEPINMNRKQKKQRRKKLSELEVLEI